MGLLEHSQYLKMLREGGPSPGKGPRQTPGEMLEQANQMVGESRVEFASKLAKLAYTDQGSYAEQLEVIRTHFGPATADIIHADVQERLDRKRQADAEREGPSEPVVADPPGPVVDAMTERMATSVGANASDAKQAVNEGGEEYDGPSADEIQEEQQAAAEATAQTLLQDMGPNPGVPQDKIPIKVDGEAMAKTEAAAADGMVQDGTVYLHPDEFNPSSPDGQKLIAEETVHWVQQQHALTGAGGERSPMPMVEGEAQRLAEAFVNGQEVEAPREVMGPDDIATFEGWAFFGPWPPKQVQLNFGGKRITVPVPQEPGKTITSEVTGTPVKGLSFGAVVVEFDDTWKVKGGHVMASAQLGAYVTMQETRLEIGPDGTIDPNLKEATLTGPGLKEGPIQLQVTPRGIEGTATFSHDLIELPFGLIPQEGFLRINVSAEGKLNAVGNIKSELPGVGDMMLQLSINNETMGGTASLSMTDEVAVAPGVTLKEATVSGNFTSSGLTMSGAAPVEIAGWGTGQLVGTYNYPEQTWSVTGTIPQSEPIQAGEYTLFGGSLSVTVKDGALTEVGGGAKFQGDSLEGTVGGTYDIETQTFTGGAKVRLVEEVQLTAKGSKLKRLQGKATFEDGQIGEIDGQGETELVGVAGEQVVTLRGQMNYDAAEKNVVKAEKRTRQLRDLSMFGGKVQLSKVSDTIGIENNRVNSAGGKAKIKVAGVDRVDGSIDFNWTEDEERPIYDATGPVRIKLNDRMTGLVTIKAKSTGEFKLTGGVELKITDKIKGMVTLSIDHNFEPTIDGKIAFSQEMLPKRKLFGLDFDIFRANVGPFFGVNLAMGASAGLKADMMPLKLNTSIGIEGWKPKSPKELPTFVATANVTTGLDIDAAVRPFVGVSGGVRGAEAGVAVEGALELRLPVMPKPEVKLKGGPDGFEGEMKIGVKVSPVLQLVVRPFLFAELGDAKARHNLAEWPFPLEFFTWQWNKTYKFGDKGSETIDGGAQMVLAQGGTANQTFPSLKDGKLPGFDNSGAEQTGDGKSAPKIEGGSELAGTAAKDGESAGGAMGDKFKELEEKAEKVANIAHLLSIVLDIVTVTSMVGPFATVAVPVYLAYRHFIRRNLDLPRLIQGIMELWALIQQGFQWLLEHLDDWIVDVYEWVKKGAKNLLLDMGDWLQTNLKALGQEAIDFLKDAGEWGKNIIYGAGQWAVDAAGWVWDTISDAGEAIADTAVDAWNWLTG